ncbi:uncharacterized [Tachysurus ichikawai]
MTASFPLIAVLNKWPCRKKKPLELTKSAKYDQALRVTLAKLKPSLKRAPHIPVSPYTPATGKRCACTGTTAAHLKQHRHPTAARTHAKEKMIHMKYHAINDEVSGIQHGSEV